MTQNILFRQTSARQLFSLNMPGVDELFPGFAAGDFAVLYGSPSVISLTSLLCVRAQLPVQLGGLGGSVIFVEGGNTISLYKITRLAQIYQLEPKKVLQRIFVSRAFTAFQLTSLIMEKLEDTVKNYNAKLVVISDIAGYFLENDIQREEAQKVYSQILNYLSSFAKKHQIIVIATYLPNSNKARNSALQEITVDKANIALSLTKTEYTNELTLEKHPYFMLGTAELPSENRTLTDFMEPQAFGKHISV